MAGMPLSRRGLQAAFSAFGQVGTDEENAETLLFLMKAIEAYLDVVKRAEAIADMVAEAQRSGLDDE
jgi:hypothetical protein